MKNNKYILVNLFYLIFQIHTSSKTNFQTHVHYGILNYIYNIAQRLTPNRRVSVNRVGSRAVNLQWNAIHQHELKKALARGKVNPRYLCENKKMFGIGRELAKKNKSFDANNQDIRLDLEYSTAATDNTLDKLLTSWMYHIRTLVISQNSLAVVY